MHPARGTRPSPLPPADRRRGRAGSVRVLRALLVGASVLAAGAGCRELTGSDALTGTYTLRTVGGQPLPHVLASGPNFQGGSERIEVLASTFHFEAGGAVRRELTLRNVSDVPARDTVHTIVQQLEYRRTGARIAIGDFRPCPSTALCGGPMTGLLYGKLLAIGSGGQEPVRHEYVATP